jgi:SAM-dependent methyltransferase
MDQAGPVTPARPLTADELRTSFEKVLDRDGPGQAGVAVAAAAPPEPPPSSTALDINALAGLADLEFIEKAYTALLGRRPDETGMRHYARLLAAGGSRVAVLGELRYSTEGRAVGTVVPGLRKRFLLHRLYRLPVLGRMIRSATAVVALPGLMRDVTLLAADLRALRGQTELAHRTIERETRSRADYAERAIEREQQARRDHAARFDRLAVQLDREPWAEPLLALAERGELQSARLDEVDRSIRSLAHEGQAVSELASTFAAIRTELGWTDEGTALARRLTDMVTEHRNVARRAIGLADENRARLQDQESRLSLILGELRGWIAHGAEAGAADHVRDQQDALLDPLYLAFEDRFRGSRADIKQRQMVYLGLLREAGAGQPGRPIVDVGSGRGELLELLGEAGLEARGVDLNASMAALCTRLGLDCTLDDAVSYLARLEADSLGAVTGFHIIEHLPFAALVALLDASLRALAPGGVIVFETPNPANLLVSSRWFHLDPTHRNPLPAEMVSMVAEARGFVRVHIRELHPMAQRFEAKDDVLAAQLDAMFHGPQDYALIAYKA